MKFVVKTVGSNKFPGSKISFSSESPVKIQIKVHNIYASQIPISIPYPQKQPIHYIAYFYNLIVCSSQGVYVFFLLFHPTKLTDFSYQQQYTLNNGISYIFFVQVYINHKFLLRHQYPFYNSKPLDMGNIEFAADQVVQQT